MRHRTLIVAAALGAVVSGLWVSNAPATAAQGLAAGKICIVVRSCNFKRNAEVRGCLSSYSCRQCDFRRAIRIRNGRTEWRSSCTWGAGS